MAKSARIYKTAHERLFRYIQEKGMRPTKVRDIVLTKLCSLPQPFTADQLVQACEEDRISIGTIYNSLRLFVDAHVIHATKRQRDGMRAAEYELLGETTNKIQVICTNCGRITDARDTGITNWIRERKYSNFNMRNFTLYLYGECKTCRIKTVSRLGR